MIFDLDERIGYGVACVYKIEFGDKIYIGSSANIKSRVSCHISNIKSGKFERLDFSTILSCDVIKISILEVVKKISVLRQREQVHIRKHRKFNLLNIQYAKSKKSTAKEWAMVRIDCDVLDAVKKYLEESGSYISIGRFFEIAAEEKLKSENK